MKNYKEQFKGKKITVMGLGLLGRALGYTKFLAECGAELVVTDLKTEEQLEKSIKILKKFKNIKFVLGGHKMEDFENKDMIIKAAGVPLDSLYIAHAIKNNIPIEMDVSLFAKCAPGVKIVGVTGTRGKSMTTMLIHEILSSNIKNHNVYLGGNMRGVATLPLLSKVKDGDILVAELDSWQLQGFGDAKISPHVSVFTTFMEDHMNYYKGDMKKYFDDKANIFKYQKKGDFLVVRSLVKKMILKNIESKLILAKKSDVIDWKFAVPGDNQRENLACAVNVAKIFNITENKIKKSVANFHGVEGRLELMKTYNGIKIYNDNNATTPMATISGLEALGGKKNIVLICGGNDKKLSVEPLKKAILKYCKAVVLIPGTGTDNLLNSKIKTETVITKNLKEAVAHSLSLARRGDTVLFSPAFSSFSQWNNEYERNDEFVKIIKKLK